MRHFPFALRLEAFLTNALLLLLVANEDDRAFKPFKYAGFALHSAPSPLTFLMSSLDLANNEPALTISSVLEKGHTYEEGSTRRTKRTRPSPRIRRRRAELARAEEKARFFGELCFCRFPTIY